jgi:hypothetical protein
MGRVFVDNVVPLRPRINPRHPSLHRNRDVVLTELQAQLIASLLQSLRGHAPIPNACDEAIELLTRGRTA